MRNALIRVKPLTQIVISIVLVAFAVIGITNAGHVAAKIVYGILIVVGLTLLSTGVRRRQASQNKP